MNSKEERSRREVVVKGPGERSEVVTERHISVPRSGISVGWVVAIALVCLVAVVAVFYIVNRNADEAANRNANLEVANQISKAQAPTIVQQPAQPAPVIIQQSVPTPLAPVIIQQPNPRDSASDDANMQDVATRLLSDDPDMTAVSITISEARAVLSGTVNSTALKVKAERLVKTVPGMKSVDNKLVVTG